jgi:SAM-dependent methyltransferase
MDMEKTMKGNDICKVCGSAMTKALFSWQQVPANIGILWADRDGALKCKKGDLRIQFCTGCGYIWNTAFDPDRLEYSQAYDNNLHYSETYSQYAKETAQNLIDRYQLHGKNVIEIGCGKGDFLILLCTLADNKGVGFDKSFEARDIESDVSARISIVQDFYGEKYTDVQGDLVASRYVLEHIDDPVMFMKMVRRAIGDKKDTIVYFEVPNVYLIVEQFSVWDFIYEHVSYFSPGSLAVLFEKCGFKVLDIYESFGGQFVGIEAVPIDGPLKENYDIRPDLNRLNIGVQTFQKEIEEKRKRIASIIKKIGNENLKVLVWGAGAKGVSYLNMLKIHEEIKYIVDINPNKHGKYIAGTGQKIVPPEFAKEYDPDMVIIMNPIYTEEIKQTLAEMDVEAEIIHV